MNQFKILITKNAIINCINIFNDNEIIMLQRATVFLDFEIVRLFFKTKIDVNKFYLTKRSDCNSNELFVVFLSFQIVC